MPQPAGVRGHEEQAHVEPRVGRPVGARQALHPRAVQHAEGPPALVLGDPGAAGPVAQPGVGELVEEPGRHGMALLALVLDVQRAHGERVGRARLAHRHPVDLHASSMAHRARPRPAMGEAPGSMSSRGLGRPGMMLRVSRDKLRSPTTRITGWLRAANRSGWRSAFSRSLHHRGGEVGLFLVLDPAAPQVVSPSNFRGFSDDRRVVGVSCDCRDRATRAADASLVRRDAYGPDRHPERGRQTWRRSAIAATISAIASSTGTPFFCDPSR